MKTSPPRTRRRSSDRHDCDGCAELSSELAAVSADRDRLAAQVERLKTDKAALAAKLEEARRAAKRQAAPFSRQSKKTNPARPGRKPGQDYGRHGRRRPPKDVDEVVAVPLPEGCPHCGGELEAGQVRSQWVEDVVMVPIRRRYDVTMGRCRSCHRPAHARHPDQSSDAFGASAVMLGPTAKALAAWLHIGLGVPMAKVAQILTRTTGISVSASALHQCLHGLAKDANDTYQALLAALRASPVLAADETGWRIDGDKGWLWVFVGDHVTVYDIASGRGYADSSPTVGEDFAGIIERDGWASYRLFVHARHQTCVAHLLRRAKEMITDSVAGQAKVPHAVARLLHDALDVRDRRDRQELAGYELEEAITALEARADHLIARRPSHEPNRKLLAHLGHERDALFTFLRTPGVQATNWRAEQALRPMICNRKQWGGNKTWTGAATASTLGSVLRTSIQQGADPIAVLVDLQRTGITTRLRLPDPPDP